MDGCPYEEYVDRKKNWLERRCCWSRVGPHVGVREIPGAADGQHRLKCEDEGRRVGRCLRKNHHHYGLHDVLVQVRYEIRCTKDGTVGPTAAEAAHFPAEGQNAADQSR